ncbi:MAG: outer membrane beta-barrel protein [Saprospiraceae bacterium]|nr:outer membrane beta-barrel protein [Saprospiraceae bacterium]
MKKLISNLLLIMLSTHLLAQSSIELKVGENLSYRLLSGKEFFDETIELRNENESAKILPSLGLTFKKNISPKSHLGVGVQFTKLGYVLVQYDDARWPDEIVNGQYMPHDTLDGFKMGFTEIYLEIPLIYEYRLLERTKWNIDFGVGISPAYILNGRNYIFSDREGDSEWPINYESGNYNRFQMPLTAHFQMNYSVSDKLYLLSSIGGAFHLTGYFKGINIVERFCRVGVYVGLGLRLNS